MTTTKLANITPNPGSFRDPGNRVYQFDASTDGPGEVVFRGVNADILANFKELSKQKFYQEFVLQGMVAQTDIASPEQFGCETKAILDDGWEGVLVHERVPFISYPYEWTFSMLKQAALLQLHLVEKSFECGWTLKDATPYNVQWIGPKPVFIDIPSFEPWIKGEAWVGYRQFCSMYLTPLMLRAHLGINHLPLLRSYLDGIPPTEASKFFRGLRKLKKGVPSHILFPAYVEMSILKRERDAVPADERNRRNQSLAMVLGLVQSLTRLIKSLSTKIDHTDWSHYDKTHTYDDEEFESKKLFVSKHAADKKRDQVWDIGCNTGTFSRLCSEFCNRVISVDGDHDAVEQLYLHEREKQQSNILPLVLDLANISPRQGWAGTERQAFDQRNKPDLILCLALIHHIRISANIPIEHFLIWLRSLKGDVVLEFVTREDEMVVKLLTNKKEQYPDYDLQEFIRISEKYFTVKDQKKLKGGKRVIFFLVPKK